MWLAALLIGVPGLMVLVGSLMSVFPVGAENPVGLAPLSVLTGLAWTYLAAAILRLWHGQPASWRPGWAQGIAVMWFGGWTIVIVGFLARELAYRGPASLWNALGGSLIGWTVLVGLPFRGAWVIRLAFRPRTQMN